MEGNYIGNPLEALTLYPLVSALPPTLQRALDFLEGNKLRPLEGAGIYFDTLECLVVSRASYTPRQRAVLALCSGGVQLDWQPSRGTDILPAGVGFTTHPPEGVGFSGG